MAYVDDLPVLLEDGEERVLELVDGHLLVQVADVDCVVGSALTAWVVTLVRKETLVVPSEDV